MSSLKDVAKLAGTSKSTVSRVISNNGPVKEDTRQKVLKAIKMLNYKPNLLASGLREKRGRLIGLIVPEANHYYFGSLIDSISTACREKNLGLLIGSHHYDKNIEKDLILSFYGRNIDGLIIEPVSEISTIAQTLDISFEKIIVIERFVDTKLCHTISLDNFSAGKIMGEYLGSLGHKNVAVITGPNNLKICNDRFKGFINGLSEKGGNVNANFIYEGDFSFISGKKGINHFYSLNNFEKITAIWAQNDLMALGIIQFLHEKNIKIPEKIAVAGLDGLQLGEMISPTLTTIKQPLETFGEKAIEILLSKNTKIKKAIRLPPILKIGNST